MATPSPEPGPRRFPPGTPERLTLGLAFVATGAALGSWFAPFRAIGVVLVLIGLGILVLAAWTPLQSVLAELRRLPAHRAWLAPVLGFGLIAAVGLLVLVWWRVNETDVAPPEPIAAPVPPRDISCIEAAARCAMTAQARNPGEPLVWVLPRSLTAGANDGLLQARARLESDIAGRYVAVACRATPERGEYVLAVRPENRSFRLIRWDGNVATELAAERRPETINPANEANHLGLRCVGSTIAALINGTPVATEDDDHLPEGGWYIAAGIFAENTQAAPIAAEFDRIQMRPATPVS